MQAQKQNRRITLASCLAWLQKRFDTTKRKGFLQSSSCLICSSPRGSDNRQEVATRHTNQNCRHWQSALEKSISRKLPQLSRQTIELFIDFEGIPDQQSYYLFGALVCEENKSTQYSYWADTDQEEAQSWRSFVDKVNEYVIYLSIIMVAMN